MLRRIFICIAMLSLFLAVLNPLSIWAEDCEQSDTTGRWNIYFWGISKHALGIPSWLRCYIKVTGEGKVKPKDCKDDRGDSIRLKAGEILWQKNCVYDGYFIFGSGIGKMIISRATMDNANHNIMQGVGSGQFGYPFNFSAIKK